MDHDIEVPQVDVREASRRVQSGAVLLDVREQEEYDEVRVPGSRLVPLSEFMDRYAEALEPGPPIAVLCRSGRRSDQAAAFLRQNGFDAFNIAGGILAWQEAELPVERGSGE